MGRESSGYQLTQVAARLYLGACPTPAAIPLLLEEDIEYALSVAREATTGYTAGTRILAVHIPIDDRGALEPWLVVAALRLLAEMETRGRTLVHCAVGASRSPSIIAQYWFAAGETASVAEGIERLRALRVVVDPHPGLFAPDVVKAVGRLREEWANGRRPRQS